MVILLGVLLLYCRFQMHFFVAPAQFFEHVVELVHRRARHRPVGDRAFNDDLADPPHGVSNEFITQGFIEALHHLDQPHIAFGYQAD